MQVLPRGRRAWVRATIPWALVLVLSAAMVSWMTGMPGRSHPGPLPPMSDQETELRWHLETHVRALADRIGERNVARPAALEAAARYLEGAFEELGHAVERQVVEPHGVRNLGVELAGRSLADEIVLAGAHYDSVFGSPGADDNATGTAAVLEIARLLEGSRLARTVRLVLFVNEEPPFFLTEAMGSRHYAARSRERDERIVAMLSLETLGYYSDREGSQRYPFPFGLLYPSRADFVGFVSNIGSRSLLRRCVGSFRRTTAFPSEGLAAPAWIPGVSWSDHSSFWEQGYPAVMVTDTALYRYPAYHTAADTPGRVDFDRLARVVAGLARVVADLAGEDEPARR